ncbi:thiamine-phosphate kinase [Kroppenstedtia pulmonis]|uniref:Thiamine-monophosphate kinase n=1 Tax=Kroppenstedtia pulmonis TaxID=1380685 RepID=A0A7D3XR82_9BACL|nr:thiamine-phosphate kinase [Kroppenstedtia pulmonis]QKG85427.1 thiamine-phosphate kinase [Kroppenstedtia pulmonis]
MMQDEFSMIRSLLRLRGSVDHQEQVEVDAGDDAAVVKHSSGTSVVLTCDTMVETVHFLPDTMTPFDIGYKCMVSNISDIAAMGGIPAHAIVSLAVPRTWSQPSVEEIYQGILAAGKPFSIHLAGGDTVAAPRHLVLSITLMGEVETGKALLRSSARPGDILFITGEIGASAGGLHLQMHRQDLRKQPYAASLIKAHRRPWPRVEAGRYLLRSGTRPACNDISDGLAGEAQEIADASGVRLVVDLDKIPVGKDLLAYGKETGCDIREWVLHGGEDFELLGSVSQTDWEKLRKESVEQGIPLFEIGRVEQGTPGVDCIHKGKRRTWTRTGYNHFADR